jgi:hypothetical protein
MTGTRELHEIYRDASPRLIRFALHTDVISLKRLRLDDDRQIAVFRTPSATSWERQAT